MSKTNQKGDIGELAVAAELVRLGYKVAIPFGHDWKYDLVVEVDGMLKRVQVKSAEPKKGTLRVQCYSYSNVVYGNRVRSSYTSIDFDYLILYDRKNRMSYNIPISAVHNTKDALFLRVEQPKKNQRSIRWAQDYLLTEL